MTATLSYPLSQITPQVRTPKPKKRLVNKLVLTKLSDNPERYMLIGTRATKVNLKGLPLVAFLLNSVFGRSASSQATVIGLDRFPDYRTRNRWRGGNNILIAVGTGEGAMIGVYGSPHALGFAPFCRGWRLKLGLSRGKVRYFRVLGVK